MIKIKTLDYYLAEDGIHYPEFKHWLDTQTLDRHSKLQLNLCCKNLEISTWLDTEKRKTLFQKIKSILEGYIIQSTGKTPYHNFIEYITELDKQCYQGGYGHHVYYKYINQQQEKYSPHHWMISPDTYQYYSSIPNMISLCALICGFYIIIDEQAEHAKWNG